MALAERFDVMAPDPRGFGDTRGRDGKPVENTTPDILAADLGAMVDALRIERVAIVSHDVDPSRRNPSRPECLQREDFYRRYELYAMDC